MKDAFNKLIAKNIHPMESFYKVMDQSLSLVKIIYSLAVEMLVLKNGIALVIVNKMFSKAY